MGQSVQITGMTDPVGAYASIGGHLCEDIGASERISEYLADAQNVIATYELPSAFEQRFDFIHNGCMSFAPLYDFMLSVFAEYGFADFKAWIIGDEAWAIAAFLDFYDRPFPEGVVPLNGLDAPYKPAEAKKMLITWCLHRNFNTGFGVYAKNLRDLFKAKNKRRKPIDVKDQLACFIRTVRSESAHLPDYYWTWPAQIKSVERGIEGSNRKLNAGILEKSVRAALIKAGKKLGLKFEIEMKETTLVSKDGVGHRIDAVVRHKNKTLLVHCKSTQIGKQAYARLYAADTQWTSSHFEGHETATATIFAGYSYQEYLLRNDGEFILYRNCFADTEKDRVKNLTKVILDTELLNFFLDQDRGKIRAII